MIKLTFDQHMQLLNEFAMLSENVPDLSDDDRLTASESYYETLEYVPENKEETENE